MLCIEQPDRLKAGLHYRPDYVVFDKVSAVSGVHRETSLTPCDSVRRPFEPPVGLLQREVENGLVVPVADARLGALLGERGDALGDADAPEGDVADVDWGERH